MDSSIRARLQTYHDLLLKWQKSVNLVAPGTLSEAWQRHFEDSLQIVNLIPLKAMAVADIGSGAGFPGLVVAVARPDLDVHLIESDSKKSSFLSVVSRETKATNVTVHNGRIEDVLPALQVDVVTARALASLNELLALTESQWDRAQMIFLKGADSQKEVDMARAGHDFEMTAHASQTAENARILCISQVRKKG